jgi:hypothetical protein
MNEELKMKNEETNPARNVAAVFNSSFVIRHSSFSKP